MNATEAVKKFEGLALSMARSAASEHVFMSEEDMFQEANIAILRAIKQANFPTEEGAQTKFVRSCILNAFRDLSRSCNDGVQFVSLDEEVGEDEGGNAMTRHDVIGAAANQEELEAQGRTSSRAQRLSKEDQELLRLTAQGCSTREIAESLGVSHVTIVKRLKKARQHLKLSTDSLI